VSASEIDRLLDLRLFVTEEAEAHDPYVLQNQIVAKIDQLLKEMKK